MKRKVISFICVCLLLVHVVLPVQRANAVVAEGSIVAAAAAIMASTGLSIWAGSSSDFNQYLSGKLSEYVASTQGDGVTLDQWLEIDGPGQLFTVVGDGAIKFGSTIANKFLDFCSWFNQSEGVVSGGATVGSLGASAPVWVNKSQWEDGAVINTDISGNRITVRFNNATVRENYNAGSVLIRIDVAKTSGDCEVTLVDSSGFQSYGRNRWGAPTVSSTSEWWGSTPYYLYRVGSAARSTFSSTDTSIGLNLTCDYGQRAFSGCTAVFEINTELSQPDKVTFTPGSVVAIRPPIAEQDSLVITTTAPITAGDSEAEASAAIIDKVISVDGLSGEDAVSEGVGAGWGWLSELLERVIGNTNHATYQPVDDYALDLTNFFPFCIPWDIYRALSLFDADPVTPSLTWDIPLPSGGSYRLDLDLHQFDGVAEVCRTLELLLFGVYLAVSTRKLIKW